MTHHKPCLVAWRQINIEMARFAISPVGAHTRRLERWNAPRSSGQSGLGWFALGLRFPQAGEMFVRVVTMTPGNGGRADRCPTRRGAVREAASGATAVGIRGRGCRRMARRSVRIGRRFLEAARLQTTGDERQQDQQRQATDQRQIMQAQFYRAHDFRSPGTNERQHCHPDQFTQEDDGKPAAERHPRQTGGDQRRRG